MNYHIVRRGLHWIVFVQAETFDEKYLALFPTRWSPVYEEAEKFKSSKTALTTLHQFLYGEGSAR